MTKVIFDNLTQGETLKLIEILVVKRLEFTATPYEINRTKRYKVEWEAQNGKSSKDKAEKL